MLSKGLLCTVHPRPAWSIQGHTCCSEEGKFLDPGLELGMKEADQGKIILVFQLRQPRATAIAIGLSP